MEEKRIQDLLCGNSYPGRGILLGRDTEGNAIISYFIMGRSVNSRNRIFVKTDADTVETRAFDESKMIDPSLIIYAPLRHLQGGTFIITNGDQTDTIRDYLEAGKSFADALRTRTFEPDAPNYTPRISGLVRVRDGVCMFNLSILKSMDDGNGVQRYFYEYENLKPGSARLIHTYQGNGSPLPSFEGEPRWACLEGGLREIHETVWSSLDADNRISLLTVKIDPSTGEWDMEMTNQNQ